MDNEELYQDLKYSSYLAEQDYYNDLSKILEYMTYNNRIPYGVITESLNEAVTNYISKVTTSTQKVWNRFKGSVDKEKDFAYLKRIRNAIVGFKSNDIMVNNYPDYDLQFMNGVKVIPFSLSITILKI